MYKKIIKPILFLFPPDFIHSTTVTAGRVVQVLPPVRWILRKWWAYSDARLNQSILDIDFANPIGLSAGFDKNVQLTPLMSSVGFGFETGGSVTLGERKGNARPWFYRLPKTQSLVVHAGLANRGIVNGEATIIKNSRRSKNLPLFISVAIVAKTSKETCQDAIINAIYSAKNFAREIRKEREKMQFVNAIVDNSTNGILSVDSNNIIINY